MKKTLCVICSTLVLFGSYVSAEELEAFELSLQELLDVEITSVARQAQPLSNSPAAVYVISAKDIKRSGATSIPQALKDVPGLHVAQIDSQKWAVSSRGFNGRFNNKLLVLMDGRTLYSPEFSGVYWEVQDTLMTDIERIEIIRGPGAAMWGANAVNGVINIVTKHSADTQGGYAEIGAGNYEQGFVGFRYGGKPTENSTARVYAKGFKRNSLEYAIQDPNLVQAGTDNDWSKQQVGGRIDINLHDSATLFLSSDLYQTKLNQVFSTPTLTTPFRAVNQDNSDSNGFNVLAKFNQALSATSEYSLQGYYDYVNRDESLFGFTTETFDLEFQRQLQAGNNHNIIWGLGYRHISDDIDPDSLTTTSDRYATNTNLSSAFIRDETTLVRDALWLTLAARVEDNSYTGLEWQPNARLFWKLNDQHKLWSSVAYAKRTPSRAEDNLNVPAFTIPPSSVDNPSPFPVSVTVKGQESYDSESLLAYEFGYRFSPTPSYSFDSTVFYNDYDNLRGVSPNQPDLSSLPAAIIQDSLFVNDQDGHSYGLEFSSQWLATNTLKLKVNYSFIQSKFSDAQTQNTTAPKHIGSLHADWAVSNNVDLNAIWRYVDAVEVIDGTTSGILTIDSFQGVDLGANWHIRPDVTLSAYGKNLFDGSRTEYQAESFSIPYLVEPSYYVKVAIKF